MFRKDPAVAKVWDKEKPCLCAKQQREIISRAAEMLAPGGQLLYSTCTFSPEENEQTIAYLLNTRDDMEIVDLPHYEGFSCGIPQAADPHWMERNFSDQEERDVSCEMLKKCVRIWPHKMGGEGHFLALLQKKKTVGEVREKDRETGNSAAANVSKQDKAALMDFFADVSMEIEWDYVEVRKGQVYYVPKELGNPRGLTFLRNGLYLGEIRKGRFEPSQSFAMALKKEEYASVINLNREDGRVLKYLKGETIEADDLAGADRKGWQLVCVEGYPLGWGKLVNGMLKNKYHAGWRMKY